MIVGKQRYTFKISVRPSATRAAILPAAAWRLFRRRWRVVIGARVYIANTGATLCNAFHSPRSLAPTVAYAVDSFAVSLGRNTLVGRCALRARWKVLRHGMIDVSLVRSTIKRTIRARHCGTLRYFTFRSRCWQPGIRRTTPVRGQQYLVVGTVLNVDHMAQRTATTTTTRPIISARHCNWYCMYSPTRVTAVLLELESRNRSRAARLVNVPEVTWRNVRLRTIHTWLSHSLAGSSTGVHRRTAKLLCVVECNYYWQ